MRASKNGKVTTASARALIIALVAMLAWIGIAAAVGWRRVNRTPEGAKACGADAQDGTEIGRVRSAGRNVEPLVTSGRQ